jgi:cytochrome b561
LTIHKSLGMTALVLIVLRVAWRLAVRAPPYSAALGALHRLGARAAHVALYALMIAMPVTGYVDSVVGGHPTSWFGLFDWPAPIARNDALARTAGLVHYGLAWALAAALALHFAAVAWHVWVKRDDVFARMGPARAGDANG